MSSPYSPYNGGPTHVCQRCGAPMTPGRTQCERCGFDSAAHSGRYGPIGLYQQGQAGPAQMPNEWPSAPSPPAQQMPMSSPSGPPPYTQGWQTGGFPSYQQPSGNVFTTGNAQTDYNPFARKSSRTEDLQWRPPAKTRGQRSSRLGARQLVGILLLVAILLVGGLLEYRYLTVRDNIGGNASSSTTKPTPTPSVAPLFSDNFLDNNNAWNLQSSQGKFSVGVGSGALTLEDDNNTLLWELLPGNATYSDFKLVVDAKLTKGDPNNGYGIYFRGTPNQNSDLASYYRFELYGDGSYALFKGVVDANGDSTSAKLVDYTADPAIQKRGGTNLLSVTANGPQITLAVNGKTLKTVNDTSYSTGTIGLFVSNLEGSRAGAQAQFSKLAIYPV